MYQSPPSTIGWSRARTGWWIGLTVLAGMLAGAGGYMRFRIVCDRICGPPQQGIWTVIPGYDEAVEAGAVLAGILAAILVISMQGIILAFAIRKPLWLVTLFPSVFFSSIAAMAIIDIPTTRTDFIDTGGELMTVGIALILIGLAGLNIGISYAFALALRTKETLVISMTLAWVGGWLVFGLSAVFDIGLIAGWLCCWLIVGILSAAGVRRALDHP